MLPIEDLRSASADQQTEVLGQLFEPCSTLNAIIFEKVIPIGFSTYKDLIEAVRSTLLQLLKENEEDPQVSKIIAAHPRLGAPKKGKVVLSAHSLAEQKSLSASSPEETAMLQQLNEDYEKTFPGLRYVVFVNGRPRSVIMENMRERIKRGDILKERYDAFNAMCDIALDRVKKENKL